MDHGTSGLVVHLLVLLVSQLAVSLVNEFIVNTLRFRHASLLGLLSPVGVAVSGLLTGGLASRKAPLRSHIVTGVALYLAFYLGSKAQLHLAYSEFLVAKASKLAPTMAIGFLWLKKRYSFADILAAALALVGLTLALQCSNAAPDPLLIDEEEDSEQIYARQCAVSRLHDGSWMTGILCISTALLCDGLYANTQEQQMHQYGASAHEVASFGMGIASVLFVASSIFSPAMLQGLRAAVASGPITIAALAAFTVCNYLASLTALSTVRTLGAAKTGFLLAVCKAVAVLFSMILFPKPTSLVQIGGMVLVFVAVAVAIVFKSPAGTSNLKGVTTAPQPLLTGQESASGAPGSSFSQFHASPPGLGAVTPRARSRSDDSKEQQQRRLSLVTSWGMPALTVLSRPEQHASQMASAPSPRGQGDEADGLNASAEGSCATQVPEDGSTQPASASTSPSIATARFRTDGVALRASRLRGTHQQQGVGTSGVAAARSGRDRTPSHSDEVSQIHTAAASSPPMAASADEISEAPVPHDPLPLIRLPLPESTTAASLLIQHAVASSPLVSRTLSRIATASELALEGATGIERPQGPLLDCLSPLSLQPPRRHLLKRSSSAEPARTLAVPRAPSPISARLPAERGGDKSTEHTGERTSESTATTELGGGLLRLGAPAS